MSRVSITLACGDYDRTEPLRTGAVTPEGVDLTYLALPPEEIFYRMLRHHEFEAAELSMSSYLMNFDRTRDFIALPVFPSRTFRHNAVYVRADSGIREPADLDGRQVGVPEYQMTAAVWIRGTFAERHGLPVNGPRYRTGGLNEPGRVEKLPLPDHLGVDIEPIAPDQTLTGMLLDGRIDALYSARLPLPVAQGDPRITRLFPDPRPVEEAYARDTGIFPIMHLVVLRGDVHTRHPWLARTLYKAFEEARGIALARIGETNALRYSLPWLYDDVARARDILGQDYWPYGVEANDTTLRTLMRYSYEQGLTGRRLAASDIFAPECLDAYRV